MQSNLNYLGVNYSIVPNSETDLSVILTDGVRNITVIKGTPLYSHLFKSEPDIVLDCKLPTFNPIRVTLPRDNTDLGDGLLYHIYTSLLNIKERDKRIEFILGGLDSLTFTIHVSALLFTILLRGKVNIHFEDVEDIIKDLNEYRKPTIVYLFEVFSNILDRVKNIVITDSEILSIFTMFDKQEHSILVYMLSNFDGLTPLDIAKRDCKRILYDVHRQYVA